MWKVFFGNHTSHDFVYLLQPYHKGGLNDLSTFHKEILVTVKHRTKVYITSKSTCDKSNINVCLRYFNPILYLEQCYVFEVKLATVRSECAMYVSVIILKSRLFNMSCGSSSVFVCILGGMVSFPTINGLTNPNLSDHSTRSGTRFVNNAINANTR